MHHGTTVEPRYNEPRYNQDPVITNNKTRQNYSKICGNKHRYNEPRYNEISAITNSF